MLQLKSSISERDQVIDTMISLTRLSSLQRAIVAGPDSADLYLALHRRGFVRVGLPARFGLRRATCPIGLITVRDSFAEFEAALFQIAPSLGTSATIAALIKSDQGSLVLQIRKKLEQLGFRIEAGVRCRQGLVLSAHRQGLGQMEAAA
jgi:hypothetical protein